MLTGIRKSDGAVCLLGQDWDVDQILTMLQAKRYGDLLDCLGRQTMGYAQVDAHVPHMAVRLMRDRLVAFAGDGKGLVAVREGTDPLPWVPEVTNMVWDVPALLAYAAYLVNLPDYAAYLTDPGKAFVESSVVPKGV